MRYLTVALIALIALVHAELWFGKAGVPHVMELQAKLQEQKAENEAAHARNDQITAEVRDLKEGLEMNEEKARFELGIDPTEDQGLVREILLRTGGPGTAADLVRLDSGAATYRIAGPGADLAVRVASALRAEGVKLGRPQAGAPRVP